MRTLILCLLITSLFQGCTSFPTQGIQQGERRVALVIGNYNYADYANKNDSEKNDSNKKEVNFLEISSNLDNVKNDVEDMTNTLRRLGFQVLRVPNANKKEMEVALKAFKKLLEKEKTSKKTIQKTENTEDKSKTLVALFYYSGHGVASENETYLIPIGTKPLPCDPDKENKNKCTVKDSSLKEGTISLSDVYKNMQGITKNQNNINFVILDSCRNIYLKPKDKIEKNESSKTKTDKGPEPTYSSKKTIQIGEIEVEGITYGANKSEINPPDHTFLAYATARDTKSNVPTLNNNKIWYTKLPLISYFFHENSTYTKHLLSFISKPGLPISELFGKVNEAVVEETKQIIAKQKAEKKPTMGIQEPHFSSYEISSEVNFVFRPQAVNQTPRW